MKISISVLMLAISNAEMCREAVSTLREYAKMDYQLIFVDNGSEKSEGLCEAIRPLLGKKDIFIRNEVNRSFSRANNQALAVADGSYILGLNNDTVTHGDWQTPLLTDGLEYDLCGPTVRRLVIDEKRKLMLCNTVDGRMADADISEVGSYIEGWCFFTRKDYLVAMGGLDEVFWPMYCEDSDLSFKVRSTGGKLGKVAVPIKHLGGQDTRKVFANDYRAVVGQANCYKLYARWVKGAII